MLNPLTKSDPLCPHCGSSRVKRSRSRNFFERALKGLNFKAYRCRDCNWRGILRTWSREGKTTSSREMARNLSMIAAVILAVIVAIMLARYLG